MPARTGRAGSARKLHRVQRINKKAPGRRFTSEDVAGYLRMLSNPNLMVRTYAMEQLIAAGPRFKDQIAAFQRQSSQAIRAKLDIVLSEIGR